MRQPIRLTREQERWLYGPRSPREDMQVSKWLALASLAIGALLIWLTGGPP